MELGAGKPVRGLADSGTVMPRNEGAIRTVLVAGSVTPVLVRGACFIRDRECGSVSDYYYQKQLPITTISARRPRGRNFNCHRPSGVGTDDFPANWSITSITNYCGVGGGGV